MSIVESGVEDKEIALFCRQFAGMMEAGLDVLKILEVLKEQTVNLKLREIVDSVTKDLRLGRLLSTALGRFPEVFSPFFLNMVRQAERDETVPRVLVRLAEHLERGDEWDILDLGERVAVKPGTNFMVEQLWPLVFWLSISVAVVSISIAGLWYATNADVVPREALGPNIALLVGVLVLVSSLLFSRFKPLRTDKCSFCGKRGDQVPALQFGIGVAICDDCVVRNYKVIQAHTPRTSEGAGAGEDRSLTPQEEIEEEIIAMDGEDFEVIREKVPSL